MSQERVLRWIVMLMAVVGLLDGHADGAAPEGQGGGLHLLAGMAVGYLCFLWYRSDSDARGFARSRWLSAGVAAFAPGVIPYYLLRSRNERERAGALLAYAACLAVAVFAVWVGMAVRIGLA